MHIGLLIAVSLLIVVLTIALQSRRNGTEDASPACLDLLDQLIADGGRAAEDAALIVDHADAAQEAVDRGYLSLGGGWSVGYTVTPKGRRRWSEGSPVQA